MCEAARRNGVHPWQLSFQATMTALEELVASPATDDIFDALLACSLAHKVGNRPDRSEPRVVKRRKHTHKLMTKPRWQYKPSQT